MAKRRDSFRASKAGNDAHIKQKLEVGDSKGLLRLRIMHRKR